MDRSVVSGMVEDFWRAFLTVAQTGDVTATEQVGHRFEERIQKTAELMEPVDAAAFLQMVEAERERMIQEYNANPAVVKQRLGVPLGIDGPAQPSPTGASGLGRLAVRTAVRATIWESIWALFRAAR